MFNINGKWASKSLFYEVIIHYVQIRIRGGDRIFFQIKNRGQGVFFKKNTGFKDFNWSHFLRYSFSCDRTAYFARTLPDLFFFYFLWQLYDIFSSYLPLGIVKQTANNIYPIRTIIYYCPWNRWISHIGNQQQCHSNI